MINWNKLTEFIDSSSDILLSTHRDPDGDGLGSVVAMYYYLKSINKNVRIINKNSFNPASVVVDTNIFLLLTLLCPVYPRHKSSHICYHLGFLSFASS